MKKLLVLGTIPLLLCSCASDPVIEEREYVNPEMDTGKQVPIWDTGLWRWIPIA